jgi:hypothetical protein
MSKGRKNRILWPEAVYKYARRGSNPYLRSSIAPAEAILVGLQLLEMMKFHELLPDVTVAVA